MPPNPVGNDDFRNISIWGYNTFSDIIRNNNTNLLNWAVVRPSAASKWVYWPPPQETQQATIVPAVGCFSNKTVIFPSENDSRGEHNRSEKSNIKHHPIIGWFIPTFIVGGGITYCKPGDQPLRLRGVVEAAAQVEEHAPPGNLTNKNLKSPSYIFISHFNIKHKISFDTSNIIMKGFWDFHIFPHQISMSDTISIHFTWKLALCWHFLKIPTVRPHHKVLGS